MSQLVRLEGKHITQNSHCAVQCVSETKCSLTLDTEEDFNTKTKKLQGGIGWLSQTIPLPRPPDGDKKNTKRISKTVGVHLDCREAELA